MSKLKVAKAVQKSFTVAGKVIKWTALTILVVGLATGLWAWANAHFLSFAIVIGIVLAILGLAGILTAMDWSEKVIKEAKEEEQEAQKRDRMEKLRKENPRAYNDPFEGYDDPVDRHSAYR